LQHELERARTRLAQLPSEERLTVEQVSASVAAALVDGILEEARKEPSVAQAIASIYGAEPAWEPRAVSCSAD
jgi:hypothetical protein